MVSSLLYASRRNRSIDLYKIFQTLITVTEHNDIKRWEERENTSQGVRWDGGWRERKMELCKYNWYVHTDAESSIQTLRLGIKPFKM